MARTPAKAGSTRTPGTAKPKAVKAAAPAKAKKASAAPAAPKPRTVKAAKPAKAADIGAKASSKSLLKDGAAKISTLASDILADRIVPTIEQIKQMAESLLGQKASGRSKSKKKKK